MTTHGFFRDEYAKPKRQRQRTLTDAERENAQRERERLRDALRDVHQVLDYIMQNHAEHITGTAAAWKALDIATHVLDDEPVGTYTNVSTAVAFELAEENKRLRTTVEDLLSMLDVLSDKSGTHWNTIPVVRFKVAAARELLEEE